ncbi:uncharacterized protein LOC102701998 [Oryza brachyantha]|uniref:uncharacterized protein LOC102701998 n=1 Tax=Oryza brachyantha TaxID=4533 RepID=UPI001ADC5622|nr:uncharacterized protein LOC102701998 [Oryza brachyantha]
MASSPSTSVGGAGEVCCMCGDRGLPEELLRCRLCGVRLQHRYCSDLYPRATAYRRCNWCLRDPAPGGGGHAHTAADKPTVRRKASSSSPTDQETSTSGEAPAAERQRLQEATGCSASRRAPGTGLGRPVKKQKAADEVEAPAKGNGSKKPTQAGKKTGVKVKVRRYKLLAEVISC